MHASNESTNTRPEFTSSPLPSAESSEIPYWEFADVSGPADLYMAFALTAAERFLKDYKLNDDTFLLVMEAAEIAASVVVKAAHVPENWLSSYGEATAHLRMGR